MVETDVRNLGVAVRREWGGVYRGGGAGVRI
jgi:hypothetical protein